MCQNKDSNNLASKQKHCITILVRPNGYIYSVEYIFSLLFYYKFFENIPNEPKLPVTKYVNKEHCVWFHRIISLTNCYFKENNIHILMKTEVLINKKICGYYRSEYIVCIQRYFERTCWPYTVYICIMQADS